MLWFLSWRLSWGLVLQRDTQGMTTEGNSSPISLGPPGNLYLVLMLETFSFSRELLSFCKAENLFAGWILALLMKICSLLWKTKPLLGGNCSDRHTDGFRWKNFLPAPHVQKKLFLHELPRWQCSYSSKTHVGRTSLDWHMLAHGYVHCKLSNFEVLLRQVISVPRLCIVQEQPQNTLFSVPNLLLSIITPETWGILLSYVI